MGNKLNSKTVDKYTKILNLQVIVDYNEFLSFANLNYYELNCKYSIIEILGIFKKKGLVTKRGDSIEILNPFIKKRYLE